MKFQDEGPKLRQHFEKAAQKGPGDDVSKSDHTWREVSSSVSSGTSSSSSPDADPDDITALQIALRERPKMLAWFENSDVFAPDRDRWSEIFCARATLLPESTGDFGLTEENILQFLDLKRQWVPSPSLQQQQLLYTFTSSLSSTTTKELSPVLKNHGNWLAYLPPLSGTNPLLDNAVRACTLAHLGRLNNSDHVLHEAQAHYGRALRLLSAALQDTDQGMASETLSATVLLSFYEMLASDSDQSWIRHAGGASTLMKIRGPARHRWGFDREIFLAYRHALVIQCFEVQTPCFLDEPEWLELSRQIFEDMCASGVVGDKLDLFDAMHSFFVEMTPLPGLMCDARNIAGLARAKHTDSKTIANELIGRATIHRAKLKGTHMRMKEALKRLGHDPIRRISGDPVFPIRYDYTNVFTGGIWTGYWTVLIVLDTLLKELDGSAERSAMYQAETAEAAREICRSSAWMSTSSFLGPFLLTFALRVSLLALADETQRLWILGQLAHLGATRLSMAKDLPLREPSSHPETGMPKVRDAVNRGQAFIRHYINAVS